MNMTAKHWQKAELSEIFAKLPKEKMLKEVVK